MPLQITCTSKRSRLRPHERLRRVGGRNSDGTSWWLTLEEAIAGVEAGRYSFYVLVGARNVDVLVDDFEGRKYLRTEADDQCDDYLLSLPECR